MAKTPPDPGQRQGDAGPSRSVGTAVPPDQPVKAAFKREQSLFTRHRYRQALTLLGELLARPDLKPRQRFEALIRKAECLEHLKRPGQAVDLLREVARAFPRESLGHSLLGEYLYRIEDDCAAALASLNRSLAIAPKDPDTLWWKGQIFQHGFADMRRARKAYEAALEAKPKYAAAMESLASVHEAQGNWIDAIMFRKAHYRHARAAADLAQLSDLYLRVGNVPAAMKYARTAVRRDPRSAAAWLNYAKAHATGRRFERAARALKRFARLADPEAGPFVYARDFAALEPIADRPDVDRLLPRLPTQ